MSRSLEAQGDPAARPRVEVVQLEERHDEALAGFFRHVWNAEATAERVAAARNADRAADPHGSAQSPPAFAFLLNDEVVGYVGTIPNRFWSGSEELPGHWIKGLMVLPEHRNGPIGFLVLKEASMRTGLAAGMVVADPAIRLFEALGYRNLGPLENRILPLRPGRVLRRLDADAVGLSRRRPRLARALRFAQRTGLTAVPATFAALALSALALRTRLQAGSLATGTPATVPAEELDSLWRGVRSGIGAGSVRDGAYLNWRYGDRSAEYGFVTAREGGALAGVAVVRRPREEGDARLRGIRIATIADILFPTHRSDVGAALLEGSRRLAHAWNADAVLCSGTHPALLRLLRTHGFLKGPANVNFLLRGKAPAGKLPDTLQKWWLTRGDSEADGVF
jgi:hypothetical protein